MVGAIGFEPTTPCAQGRCATRLRYAPTLVNESILNYDREGSHLCAGRCSIRDRMRGLSSPTVFDCIPKSLAGQIFPHPAAFFQHCRVA